ncbi:hypothetical protein Y032_0533g3051 [Ancylostoma ceylanicum]|uniref:Uncharacterized protein n=1 Tax=Ancylostoma ceylanicum TaxID=53326 RepID=A0A016WTL0_9BILA|nr:hypothetical protein Y032_0533g3051 [Ancylostoma ceylanicum]
MGINITLGNLNDAFKPIRWMCCEAVVFTLDSHPPRPPPPAPASLNSAHSICPFHQSCHLEGVQDEELWRL